MLLSFLDNPRLQSLYTPVLLLINKLSRHPQIAKGQESCVQDKKRDIKRRTEKKKTHQKESRDLESKLQF